MLFFRRWAWAILLLLFSFTAFYASGIDNGASHDRLKYLSIAWTMYESGHYLIPLVNGIPYTDKPPLMFWLMVSAWHLFGVNMFSLQCLIDLLLISWGLMIRAIYETLFPSDHLGKDLIPYVLIGSYAIWRDVWFLRVDILLLTGILLCNLGILKILANATIKRAYIYIALGTCIGLFAKGPIVFVFTLLPFLASVCFTKENRTVFLKIIGPVLLGTLVFLISWTIPAILYSSHIFAKQILYQQIAHRAAHSDKSYFVYLYQYIPMLFLPWIFNLIFFKKFKATFDEVPRYRSFILSIFAVSIIIFSCFGQKSLWYILPIFPFGLIFFTRFFVENKNQRKIIRLNRIILSVIFGFFSALSISLILSPTIQAAVFKNFGGYFPLSPFLMLGLASISFLTVGYLCFSKSYLTRLVSVASVMLLLVYGLSNLYFFPFEQQFTQIKQVGTTLHDAELNHIGIVLYQSEYLGQFTYEGRLTEVIPTLNTSFELENWLQKNPNGIVLYSGTDCPVIANLHVIASFRERVRGTPYLLCQILTRE